MGARSLQRRLDAEAAPGKRRDAPTPHATVIIVVGEESPVNHGKRRPGLMYRAESPQV